MCGGHLCCKCSKLKSFLSPHLTGNSRVISRRFFAMSEAAFVHCSYSHKRKARTQPAPRSTDGISSNYNRPGNPAFFQLPDIGQATWLRIFFRDLCPASSFKDAPRKSPSTKTLQPELRLLGTAELICQLL
ncbi:hypothetical protein CEXT_333321 [Caerostris extrusa]|uniref:Uncharacterized protein n=1 Tax=Caerostris extrusa TaxID=172846 RepID=A0AAV4SZN7_CAEEX|nr:hypothetical protein CEXT_333321 [Caerostris extrusa]